MAFHRFEVSVLTNTLQSFTGVIRSSATLGKADAAVYGHVDTVTTITVTNSQRSGTSTRPSSKDLHRSSYVTRQATMLVNLQDRGDQICLTTFRHPKHRGDRVEETVVGRNCTHCSAGVARPQVPLDGRLPPVA